MAQTDHHHEEVEQEIAKIPLSFASGSIGLPQKHTLHQKIEAITQAGFRGIELSFPDLLSYASSLPQFGHNIDIAEDDYTSLAEAARSVRHLCSRHELDIIVLQPFSNFEGWPLGSSEREEAFKRAKGWIEIMKAGDIKMLQVGSTDSPPDKISSSKKDLARDLGQLADVLAENGFKLAYENWCWGTFCPKWKDAWELLQLTGPRENIGLCLDTFQTVGGELADPATQSGWIERDEASREELWKRYRASLEDLASVVPKEKIYFLQVSDAYLMTDHDEGPMEDQEDEQGLRPRGRWSHDWRPLPYDGGYLGEAIEEFASAVLRTGFRGWISVEVFDGKWEEKYGNDLLGFANKARDNTRRLLGKGLGHLRQG